MNFIHFGQLYPKIMSKQARVLSVFENPDLPKGVFAYAPLYCADRKCDCRRAFVIVEQLEPVRKREPLACISYGWEPKSFYRKDWGFLGKEVLDNFVGPALDDMNPQSRYAPAFLEIFKEIVAADKEYVNRFRQQYALFKWSIGAKLPKEAIRWMGMNKACPCDSGKILRTCCAERKSLNID